jgi:chitinase
MAGPRADRSARLRRPRTAAAVGAAVLVLAIGGSAWLGGSAGVARPPALGPAAASGDPTAPTAPTATTRPAPGHELYGFVPYWEIDGTIARHIEATDLTTIALFSVTNTTKGAIATRQNGYRRISGPIGRQIIREAHQAGRRVDLAYTSFGRDRNASLFAATDVQDKVIVSLVALRKELGVDGIAVDVEQIDDLDIPAYGAFIGRLRTALRADHPGATVTVATTAGPQGAALAAAANLAGADRIFLMGYDYRSRSSEPGASAPLVARRDGDERTLAWSLDLYEAAGVPVTRTLLGLPLYGVAWPTLSADLGAPATGTGSVWVPRQNLGTLRDRTLKTVVDPIEDVGFLAVPDGTAWTAIYYDTPGTLAPKLGLADERGLAGAGLWALGYDRGLPAYTKLLADFRAGRLPQDAPAAGVP